MTILVSPQHPPVVASRPLVRIVVVGHVDHGKSTLIGRLLHDTGSLPDGKLAQLRDISTRRGMPFEWSFVLDALQTERDQNITIDTSQIRFQTPARDFVLIDAPGHVEFLRNMITGAAQADAAVLVVDAVEGVREQTRRHGYLLQLLGIRQIIVVINKMDRVAYDIARFAELEADITDYLAGLSLAPLAVIPISARQGEGITTRSAEPSRGRPTLVDTLDTLIPARHTPDLPLRFPVQAIYKFDDRRILAGRVESGRIAIGDDVVVLPAGARTRVKSIESWPAPGLDDTTHHASAGQSIGITLSDPLFIERGAVIARADAPASVGRLVRARIFWFDSTPLQAGATVVVRLATESAQGVVSAIRTAVDPGSLAPAGDAASIGRNHVGEIELTLDKPIAADPYETNPSTGRLVLEANGRIAGGGLLLRIGNEVQPAVAPSKTISLKDDAATLAPVLHRLSPGQRIAQLRRHLAGEIVFTTSFGLEDQLILHWIAEHGLDIAVVTLDTGRLFEETYALWAATEERYGLRIRAMAPNHDHLEALVARQGINGFYRSREAREACCHVRKVEPLNRALSGADGWITGLRAEQSAHRAGMAVIEADAGRHLLKLNPLFDWTRAEVADFAARHAVPVNPLHDRGFASIGCAPCTRAIAPGEPERAGRWWWEQDGKTECGLHLRPKT